MKFKFSRCVAIQTPHKKEMVNFYIKTLGMSLGKGNEVGDGPGRLFIMENQSLKGPILELMVNNVEEARDYLLVNGCTVVRWEGAGKDCYIRDPFGTIFNLWQGLDLD